MGLPFFEHFKPAELKDVFSLLSQYKKEARVVLGGTDLLPRMKREVLRPKALISLTGIPGLRYIRKEEGSFKIGALTTLREIEDSSIIKEQIPCLAQAVHTVGTVQLRNIGTIVGNICQDSRCWYYNQSYLFGHEVWERCFKRGGKLCHVVKKGKRCYAVYSGDVAPVLLVLGAELKLECLGGERLISLNDFFSGLGETVNVLQSDEIVTELRIPDPAPLSFGVYLKYRERGSIDYAIVGVAILFTIGSGERIKSAKIALTSVSSLPVEAIKAEEILKGGDGSEELFDEVAHTASREIHPVANHGYSAWYLREMVRVLTKSACVHVWELAKERR